MAAKDKKIALTITANTRQLRRDMRRAGAEVKGFERQVTGLGAKLRGIRMRFQRTGIFGRGGGMLRTAAGFAGAFGMQQMVSSAKEMNASLTDIAITGKLTDAQLNKLKKMMFEVSNATGKSTAEVLSFVSAMTTATGDTKAAMVALKDIGDVSVATGADMGSLGQVFVKLTTSMKVLPREARQAFNILRGQELVGAVTMAQMASVLPEVVGSAGIMGKSATGLAGVSAIGGLMQMTRRGTGSVEEAKTSSGRFLQDLYRNRKKVKKHLGVDIMDPGGNVRDLTTIFGELATSMAKPGMLGKALEKGIFNVRSIKAATQLAMAGGVGLGGKQGTLESFRAVFGAGKVDEIGAGKKRREASAAFQYDKQVTILANTFKKHMLPVFGQLAKSMKEWGPDLVRAIKFLLENSRALLMLWAGHKGVTFFKNLMAPIQGGAMGGMGQAVAGMSQGVGGGGTAMLPGGQIISAGRPGGMYVGNRTGWHTTRGGEGGWISRGRSGGSGYVGGGLMAGMGGPRVAAGGGWGDRSGRNVGYGLRQRIGGGVVGLAGSAVTGLGRYGGSMARGGGAALGYAGMMGLTPRVGPAWADMASNMALASANPYGMAAGGAYKWLGGAYQESGGKGTSFSDRMGKMAEKLMMGTTIEDVISKGMVQKLKDIQDKTAAELAKYTPGAGVDKRLAKYGKTWRGYEQQKEAGGLIERFGGFIGEGGVMGISPQQRVDLARKHGGKGAAGLKALQSRIGGARGAARQAAAAALRAEGKAVNEQTLEAASPQYAKLNDLYKALDKLILDILSGKKITVNAVMPNGTTPGQRVEANNSSGHQMGNEEYMNE